MKPRLETLKETRLAGISMKMSLAENRTAELWRSFMPRRAELKGAVGRELIALQRYSPGYFESFNPSALFEKWAAVKVQGSHPLPQGMETLTVPEGLYAVFHYKGSSTDPSVFRYIYGTWLPASAYLLDDRPHFEVLGEKYRNADPESEEEIWIPIRPR